MNRTKCDFEIKQFFESLFLNRMEVLTELLSSVTKSMGISFANIDPML